MSNAQNSKTQEMKKAFFICLILITIGFILPKFIMHDSPLSPNEDPLTSLLLQETRTEKYSIDYPSPEATQVTYALAKMPYDETDYVSQTLTTALVLSNYVFKNTDTQLFQITMEYEGTPTTSYIITRDNFLNIDWDSLSTSGHYDKIVPLFQKFYVKDDLMKNVAPSKVSIKKSID